MQFIVYCRVYFHESWRTKSLVQNFVFQVCIFWSSYAGHRNMVRSSVLLYVRRMPTEVRLFDLCHSALVASAVWDSIIASDSGLDTLDKIPWYVWYHYSQSVGKLMHHQEYWCEELHFGYVGLSLLMHPRTACDGVYCAFSLVWNCTMLTTGISVRLWSPSSSKGWLYHTRTIWFWLNRFSFFAYRIYRRSCFSSFIFTHWCQWVVQNKKLTVVIPIVCFAFKSLLCT